MTSTRIRSMLRLAPIVLAALAVAGVASAAGPGWGTTNSIAAGHGTVRYTANAKHGSTPVSLLQNGRRVATVTLRGAYGFPVPTNDGTGAGLSHDGRTLVLARIGGGARFAALDARTLRVRRTVALHGQFTFDALSPTGSTLYLIQHLASNSGDRYYVRAYDLRAGRLLKQIVFDAREKGGAMTGWAVTRVTGQTGRWVYTLYGRSNGTLFVHALDSVDRHAVCVDLPGRMAAQAVWNLKLTLKPGTLVVRTASKRLAVIDTKTLRVRA